jgi:hypothetical protein
MKRFLYILPFILFFFGCKTGSELGNIAPQTKIFLDKIELTGQDRLNSVVTMHWAGEDPDGYVKGYEFSFDNKNWIYTTRQDSTFRFSISGGSDTMNVPFYVRAIDNTSAKDESAAFLQIPIRNTAPTVAFNDSTKMADTTYSVFSVLWFMSDLDGVETIDSVFIRANNGTWISLPKTVGLISIVPESPKINGIQNGKIYLNETAITFNAQLSGLKVGDMNQLYIKVRDNAGTYSKIDSSNIFFLRRQTADLLVIDEHVSTSLPLPEEVYVPIFNSLGVAYDLYDISNHPPVFWEPTLQLWFNLYDKVFWYGEGKEYSAYGNKMYLEVASLALQNYLNQGGKLIVSTKFPARFNTPIAGSIPSTIFSYSPFDSLSSAPGPNTVRLPSDSLIFPVNAFASSYPNLHSSSFLTAVDPAYAKNPLQNLYHADLQKGATWAGPASICGTTRYSNNKVNQIFFTVELHKLNGDATAYQQLWQKILTEELNW